MRLIFPVVEVNRYHKILEISPSKYKPLKLVTQKTFRKIAPPSISPRGLCMEIALKYKIKQKKNSTITHKFPSNYRLAQSIL